MFEQHKCCVLVNSIRKIYLIDKLTKFILLYFINQFLLYEFSENNRVFYNFTHLSKIEENSENLESKICEFYYNLVIFRVMELVVFQNYLIIRFCCLM